MEVGGLAFSFKGTLLSHVIGLSVVSLYFFSSDRLGAVFLANFNMATFKYLGLVKM